MNSAERPRSWSRDRPTVDVYGDQASIRAHAPQSAPRRTASQERGLPPRVPQSRGEGSYNANRRIAAHGVEDDSFSRSSADPPQNTVTRMVSPQSSEPSAPPFPTSHQRMESCDVQPTHVDVTAFMAQSAFTQKNPFRQQTFAEFTANPVYEPPPHIKYFPEAKAQTTNARMFQGDLLVQRVMRSANEGGRYSADEIGYIQQGLLEALSVLEEGDWFYKWSRANRPSKRFVRVDLRLGIIQWFFGPEDLHVLSHSIRLCEIMSITSDSVLHGSDGRTFLRMCISTPARNLYLATQIREKYNMWFETLQRIVQPNMANGVPTLWGRPSDMTSRGAGGAVGRWASRYSPLHAVLEGYEVVVANQRVLSSD